MKPVEIEFLMRDRLSGGIDGVRMKTDLLDASLKRMATTVGTAFTLTKAIEFGEVMMDVRGRIESFQISFEALIGSKDKASAFFSEIKDFATQTPLILDDLAGNAQTLLGFGVETEKVIPILKQIGDVTMGNKERFNAMSLAFAQMHAAGKLMGQDLLQMVNAGFNPLKIISEQTGKSMRQMRDEMADGAISAEMVARAFADVTSEGGKFHGMLAKQSEGINGMKAQFQGAIQNMLSEMGASSQKLYTDGLKTATSLVKNYETVGKVLVGLIATYGSYKAAVIVVSVILKEQAAINAMVAASNGVFNKSLAYQWLWMERLQKAQALLNKTMLANPYVFITTTVVALGMALWALHDSTTAEEKAQKKLNDTLEDAKAKKESYKNKVHELIDIIKDETQTIYAQIKAYEELKKITPEKLKGMSREQIAALAPDEIKKAVNEEADRRDVENLNEELARQEQLLANINATIGKGASAYAKYEKEAEKILETDGFWKSRANDIFDAKRGIEAYIAKLKEQKSEQESIARQEEFESKSVQEKIAYYNEEIAKLDIQKRQLDTILLGNKDIAGQWGQINFETLQNVGHLDFVNKKLNEMKGKLGALQTLPANSNYGDLYDKAKADWEAAKKVLAEIEKDRKKYTKDQYENAKTAESTAKKTYGDLGGDVSSSKKTSDGMTAKEKANILKAERAARERQIQEYTTSLMAQKKQSEFDIAQAGIDAMKSGFEKERAIIDLQFRKLVEEQRLRKEKWIRDLQANENLKYENDNPDWKKKGLSGPAVVTEDNFTPEQAKQIEAYEEYIVGYKKQAEKEMLENSLKQYETYAQRYFDIQKKYQDEIDELRKSGASKDFDEISESMKNVGNEMLKKFGGGNVDLLARPLVDAAELVKKGWEDAGEGVATVFSSQFGIEDANGKNVEILVTPILPDGTVLSPEELDDYVDNILNGAENILAADEKGILISVGVSEDGSSGELLHQLQEKYYEYSSTVKAGNEVFEAQKTDALKNLEESIGLAEQAGKDAMTALDEEFAQKEDTFKDLMARIGYMTLQQLEKTLKEAEDALEKSDIDNGRDSKQSATQRAKIKKLKEEIKAVETENEMEGQDREKQWKKTENAIRDCKTEIDGMIDSMDFLDESTKSALQAASNVAGGAIAMISGIQKLSTMAGQSISAVEKASVILAIVGAAVQIITAIFNMASAAEARHQEALNEIAREKTAFQREYNLLLIEQNELLKQAETIFGVDAYGKALGSIQQMKEAIAGLSRELQGEAPNLWEYFLNPAGYREALENYRKGLNGLAGIQIKTGHEKTGLFGWGQGRDIYSSILEVYPKLIEENGKFNASLAETIMNTRTLSDEDKAALQQMIDLSRLAEEAFQAVKDYLSDIFGELGNTMSDALVDAFRNGTDAAEKFTQAVSGMLEDLGEQMIYNALFSKIINDANDRMMDVMQNENLSNEQKFNNYVGILDDMMDGVLSQQGTYNSLLEQYRQMAADRGLNLWESDAKMQSGKAGTYETASQDSITLLQGLYSSMLEHEISIDHGVENIIESMSAALLYLQHIEENTGHLNGIKKAIETMKDDIATIKRDGLRTR